MEVCSPSHPQQAPEGLKLLTPTGARSWVLPGTTLPTVGASHGHHEAPWTRESACCHSVIALSQPRALFSCPLWQSHPSRSTCPLSCLGRGGGSPSLLPLSEAAPVMAGGGDGVSLPCQLLECSGEEHQALPTCTGMPTTPLPGHRRTQLSRKWALGTCWSPSWRKSLLTLLHPLFSWGPCCATCRNQYFPGVRLSPLGEGAPEALSKCGTRTQEGP